MEQKQNAIGAPRAAVGFWGLRSTRRGWRSSHKRDDASKKRSTEEQKSKTKKKNLPNAAMCEGLVLCCDGSRCWCMRAERGETVLSSAGRPQAPSQPSQVVGERRHGAGRGGRLSMLLAAELQALSLGHAATDVRGHGCGRDDAWAAVWRARGRARGSGD